MKILLVGLVFLAVFAITECISKKDSIKSKKIKVLFKEKGKKYVEIVKVQKNYINIYVPERKGSNKLVVLHDFEHNATIEKFPDKRLCFIHQMDKELLQSNPKKEHPIHKVYRVLFYIKDMSRYSTKAQNFCFGMKIIFASVAPSPSADTTTRNDITETQSDEGEDVGGKGCHVIGGRYYVPRRCVRKICLGVPINLRFVSPGCYQK